MFDFIENYKCNTCKEINHKTKWKVVTGMYKNKPSEHGYMVCKCPSCNTNQLLTTANMNDNDTQSIINFLKAKNIL